MIAKSFGIEKCCFHEVVRKDSAEVREISGMGYSVNGSSKALLTRTYFIAGMSIKGELMQYADHAILSGLGPLFVQK